MRDSTASQGFRTLLRELRVGAGLTQSRLAERAGLAERTIQDLEGGRSRPTRLTARRLLVALGVPANLATQFEEATSSPRRSVRRREKHAEHEQTGGSTKAAFYGQGRDVVRLRLPASMTTFIGREQQLTDVGMLLSSRRLVTLTGPGGCGKTRLAVEAAARAARLCPDGIAFAPLAPISDAEHVLPTVARVLEIRQTDRTSLPAIVRDVIGERRILLVLDNFEHVLRAAGEVSDLLAACPNLRVLVTSREGLRLTGEQVYPVPPMTLPAPSAPVPPHSGDNGRPESHASEATWLFADRARGADPNIRIDATNAGDIASICERLDGLPLAIELAASRVSLLAPHEILSRLTSRLALLTGGTRDVDTRHQSLRSAIAWSYDLLNAAEQRLFRRLSVFSGGFSLDAAAAVFAADAYADAPRDAFEVVASLVAKSLVQRHTDLNDDSRFALLETIREFAAEQLEASGELVQVRRWHAGYYIHLVEEAEEGVAMSRDGRWIHRLEAEHDNLRAALSWCDASEDMCLLPKLTNPLWMFWWQRGHWVEACRWYDRVLELPVEPADRLGALRGRAQIAVQSGDLRRAAQMWDEAIQLARTGGHHLMLSVALGRRAYTAALLGDGAGAHVLAEEGLAVARQLGDQRRVALALNDVGHAALARGDTEGARLIWQESLAISRKVRLGFFVPYALQLLSMLAIKQGDLAHATTLAEEALPLFRQRDDRWGVQNTQSRIIQLAQARGDQVTTGALARENLILVREIGSLAPVADHLLYLAWVARLDGHCVRAARLHGAAEGIWATTGRTVNSAQRRDLDAEQAALRRAIGDATFINAFNTGRSFSADRAIRDALGEDSS